MVGFEPPMPPGAPADWRPKPIQYRLLKANGGKDPWAQHPADWSYGKRTPTCDCSGFVAWCLGYPRRLDGRWYSTDGMLRDARGARRVFEVIETPELGCVAVYGGRWRGAERLRAGHVGIVTGVPAEWSGNNWSDLEVTHCSSTNARRTGGAIAITDGLLWGRKGGVLLRCRLLEFSE